MKAKALKIRKKAMIPFHQHYFKLIIFIFVIAFSIFGFFVNNSMAMVLTDDVDGDGYDDTITVYSDKITVYHPRTGRTNTYFMSPASFSINSIEDTDGVAGGEIIVIYQAGTMFYIKIICDRTQTIREYYMGASNVSFSINSIEDTDGVAGNEIIIVFVLGGQSGIRIICDQSQEIRDYNLPFFSISSIENIDCLAGDEIIISTLYGYYYIIDRIELLTQNRPDCTVSPTANPGGPYTGIEGQAITLDGSGSSDSDGTIVLYEWDVDNDGTYDYSSSSPTQSHIYAQQGTYTVKLRVTDNNVATGEATTTATISDSSPLASFTASPTSGTEPLTVSLTDTSTAYDGIVSQNWDFGDGSPAGSGSSVSHVYNQNGTYTITLTVTDADGSTDTEIVIIIVNDASPTADFTGSPTSGTALLIVNFTNNSTGYDQPLTYEWDFDNDGTIDSTDQDPSYTYTSVGIYTVKLTTTDSDGSTNTLTRTDYITVTSPVYTLTVNINGSGNGTVTSLLSGIDCGTDCAEQYNEGTIVTLTAITDAGSTFTGWAGGGCSGTGDCTVTMNADTLVTATFEICPNPSVRIMGDLTDYYSLQAAYDASVDGDIIQSQAITFTETLNINRTISVTFKGSYDCNYNDPPTGETRLNGNMTISNGTVTIESGTFEVQ